jgi:hypothetical protein
VDRPLRVPRRHLPGEQRGPPRHRVLVIQHAARRLFKDRLEPPVHHRHPRAPAEHQHVRHVLDVLARVVEHPLHDRVAAIQQVRDHLLELRLRQPDLQVLRPGLVGRQVGQVDLRVLRVGQG